MTRGATVLEVILAAALFAVLLGVVWLLLGTYVGRRGAANLTGRISRTLTQQQNRRAIRTLFDRLHESIQILEPAPGASGEKLVFRDLLNRTVRICRESRALVSERLDGTSFSPEVGRADNHRFAQAIRIPDCEAAVFTTVTPNLVVVALTTSDGEARESVMSTVHLTNGKLVP